MRRFCFIGLCLLGGLSAFVILLSLLPWPGEMLAPFRPQILVGTLVLAVASLPFLSWKLTLAVGAVATLNATPMALRWFGRQVLPAPDTANLTILSLNVLYRNSDYDRVEDVIRRESADVVVASETDSEWILQLQSLNDLYPYSQTIPGRGAFGLSVHAKSPMKAEVLELGGERLPLIRAEFDTYVVYAVHPMPPGSSDKATENGVYLQQLAEVARLETKPVVLAGDFNTTLWSSNIRPLVKDRWQWPSGSGAAYTWPVGAAFLGIQIDHILTQKMRAGRFRVLEPIGSDHRPVRADLQY
ncbi:endonuclease/Exonuclease/phosphatase family protein [Asticcacaulis biprosthecium C19]|uniref:Endonuclease/Exonuclease/phosphatase family protein n=1 Tax=Asticcacaulis biprosthecium C19 TaxID=715226 RepID=F4QQY1_9CAUL|nr:endonuclease/exonuclease/phosphatase family protein [Asticcacaulis biprosthecium]EGF90618.1 endonuclease/Exonuclease/phosphatase family protein [Asticcacaulis biprosthecium C19]